MDAVFWGATISVLIAIGVFGYLVWKVIQLITQDAGKNEQQE